MSTFTSGAVAAEQLEPEFRTDRAAPMRFDKSARAPEPRVATPAFKQLVPGLLTRQVVDARSIDGDYSVEIWSLLVGPAIETSEARLPGAVVLSLNAGRVDVLVGGDRRRLEPGASTQVPEGAQFKILNRVKDRPALLRAIILSGER